MAVSEKQCDDNRQWFYEKLDDFARKQAKLKVQLDKIKTKQSKIDPDLETILGFENEHQVEAFRLYKRTQVRIKLMSSTVKIVSIINASAGFFATLINLFRGG